MAAGDQNQSLHAATDRYLSTISALAECMAEACPPVGGPYRHQLNRMRKRLAFDSNPAAIDESFVQIRAGMRQYSAQAFEHLERHRVELARATQSLEALSQMLAGRQEQYHARLRKFVDQMVRNPHADDPEKLRESVSRQASSLATALESFSCETQSLVAQIVDEIRAIEGRIAESETTDPITSLTNRREMERQIQLMHEKNEPVTLLRYRVVGRLPNEVAREIAVRLTGQFRPHDVVSRWEPNEFVILFKGPVEIAQIRVTQVVPWISGRYQLESGEPIDIRIESELLPAPELVAA